MQLFVIPETVRLFPCLPVSMAYPYCMSHLNHSLVLTVLGADRPGLIESIAALVKEYNGNWQESRMCRLGGQFAGIVQITIPESSLRDWKEAVNILQKSGLQILIAEDGAESTDLSGSTALFEIIGQDQPGIIQKITAALAKHQVNVIDLSSKCSSAPWSGEPLFEAKAEVQVPEECDLAALRSDLELIAADLMVDIEFK